MFPKWCQVNGYEGVTAWNPDEERAYHSRFVDGRPKEVAVASAVAAPVQQAQAATVCMAPATRTLPRKPLPLVNSNRR
jgi:hypothetical protein